MIMQSFKYVMDVLVPEALVRLTMEFYHLTYEEVIIGNLIDAPTQTMHYNNNNNIVLSSLSG